MNNKTFKIAFFNVLKHKRRTFLNSMTFSVNMIALIFVLGLVRGQYNMMIDKTIDLQVGHLKVYKKGYLEEKKRMPLDISIGAPDNVIEDILKVPDVKGAAKHIVTTGMLGNGVNKANLMFIGIDLENERTVTSAFNRITRNAMPENEGGILVGKRLAELMKIQPGETLMIYGRTKDNANNLVDAQVKGIYSAGFDFLEKNVAYIPFDFAASYLGMGNSATEIKVILKNKSYTASAKKAVQKLLEEKYPDLIVRDWVQEAPELLFGIQQDMITYAVVFAILTFLTFFIIVNTLTISVFERTAEIGTLRAIGMQKNEIKRMFLAEGIILGLIGVIVGGLLVLPLVYNMNVHGINVGKMSADNINMPIDPVLRSINAPVDWLIAALVCMISAVLGSWFPASNAAKTDIIHALKRGVK